MDLIAKKISNRINAPKYASIIIFRALLFFILWRICYHFFLQPNLLLDQFLTQSLARATAYFYNSSTNTIKLEFLHNISLIYLNGKEILGIAHGCNGLDLYILYLGLLLSIPSKISRFVLFLFIGLCCLFFWNLTRCLIISKFNIEHSHWRRIPHHYIFRTVGYSISWFYFCIFSKFGLQNGFLEKKILYPAVIISIFGYYNNHLFVEHASFSHVSLLMKYILYAIWGIIIWGFGWFLIYRSSFIWAMKIWNISYGIIFLSWIFYGLWDKFVYFVPNEIKKDFSHVRGVFYSPIPLAFLIFIMSISEKETILNYTNFHLRKLKGMKSLTF